MLQSQTRAKLARLRPRGKLSAVFFATGHGNRQPPTCMSWTPAVVRWKLKYRGSATPCTGLDGFVMSTVLNLTTAKSELIEPEVSCDVSCFPLRLAS